MMNLQGKPILCHFFRGVGMVGLGFLSCFFTKVGSFELIVKKIGTPCIEVTNVPVDIIYHFLLAEVLQIINDATT